MKTKIDGYVKTVLKGRKYDLESLPLTEFQIGDKSGQQNIENLSYVKRILHERNARLQLAEILCRSEWIRESSDVSSSSHYPQNNPNCVTIEHCYRDRWKKST